MADFTTFAEAVPQLKRWLQRSKDSAFSESTAEACHFALGSLREAHNAMQLRKEAPSPLPTCVLSLRLLRAATGAEGNPAAAGEDALQLVFAVVDCLLQLGSQSAGESEASTEAASMPWWSNEEALRQTLRVALNAIAAVVGSSGAAAAVVQEHEKGPTATAGAPAVGVEAGTELGRLVWREVCCRWEGLLLQAQQDADAANAMLRVAACCARCDAHASAELLQSSEGRGAPPSGADGDVSALSALLHASVRASRLMAEITKARVAAPLLVEKDAGDDLLLSLVLPAGLRAVYTALGCGAASAPPSQLQLLLLERLTDWLQVAALPVEVLAGEVSVRCLDDVAEAACDCVEGGSEQGEEPDHASVQALQLAVRFLSRLAHHSCPHSGASPPPAYLFCILAAPAQSLYSSVPGLRRDARRALAWRAPAPSQDRGEHQWDKLPLLLPKFTASDAVAASAELSTPLTMYSTLEALGLLHSATCRAPAVLRCHVLCAARGTLRDAAAAAAQLECLRALLRGVGCRELRVLVCGPCGVPEGVQLHAWHDVPPPPDSPLDGPRLLLRYCRDGCEECWSVGERPHASFALNAQLCDSRNGQFYVRALRYSRGPLLISAYNATEADDDREVLEKWRDDLSRQSFARETTRVPSFVESLFTSKVDYNAWVLAEQRERESLAAGRSFRWIWTPTINPWRSLESTTGTLGLLQNFDNYSSQCVTCS
ncbi:hypothetical protein AB1Y20_019900 [Prymnesium parvum]|uniref:Uncharacterized protein n=1 Tax=Prymnesium parvum TaxID=97485 RepID=A0AB34JVN8_PRYPA